ncbi:MAG TPA: tRNA (N(6)-L-threonylcarbamoyladenosine(37)-C(2))-methylthiotransferase MtaB, partial [Candidatus Limnocylindria bacterium]|nr:tRNA (N(6)-L-threonylcarbamoyladenosine(37)-C(2))-methylthiotransferase MtaB [Candidatus Limnocylindria bacterium]
TLGCKVNQYDAQAMLERFLEAGYEARAFGEPADVSVVVTCVVTETGEQKSRQALHRARRASPGGELVAAGCLAQKDAEKLEGLGARVVIGSRHRERVVELLERAVREDACLVAVEDVREAPYEELGITRHDGHTRAVMKVQEGCDRFCAYCIIPHVRGGIRSRAPEMVAREAARLAQAGYQEIVLTGIHLSSYGRDLADATLLDAVRAAASSGVPRLRLGSLEPVAATEEFVSALADIPSVCPQFHLSLQSGSDTVLKRMRRRYTANEFLASARRLRAAFPGCALTTDLLVGFPGETEAEFGESLAFCREVGFSRIHVFPFSRRKGTPADLMPGQLSRAEKAARARHAALVAKELSLRYREALLGTVQEVLFEDAAPDGLSRGCTPQYLEVWAPGGTPGQLARVRLDAVRGDGFLGSPAS